MASTSGEEHHQAIIECKVKGIEVKLCIVLHLVQLSLTFYHSGDPNPGRRNPFLPPAESLFTNSDSEDGEAAWTVLQSGVLNDDVQVSKTQQGNLAQGANAGPSANHSCGEIASITDTTSPRTAKDCNAAGCIKTETCQVSLTPDCAQDVSMSRQDALIALIRRYPKGFSLLVSSHLEALTQTSTCWRLVFNALLSGVLTQ